MKTSLNRTIEIEKFLNREMPASDSVLFQASVLLDGELRKNIFFQRLVYRLSRLYGRKKIKARMESIHTGLLNDPLKSSWREEIFKNFNT